MTEGRRVFVVIAGHVTHDRYGAELVAGGCAYYGARTYRALGAEVGLVTCVGDDFACDHELAGIAAQIRRGGRTTEFANRYDAGGARSQRVAAVAPPVRAADLPPSWTRCDVLHLAPTMGELDLAAWVAACPGAQIAIGAQGWVKVADDRGGVAPAPWQIEARGLAGIDVVCLGDEDLSGQGDLLERLTAAVPVVALTHGRAGCEVIVRGRSTRVGIHATAEVDPTGAGDVFAAGFVYALATGAQLVDAARLGAAAASIAVEGRAGVTLDRIGADARSRALAIATPGRARQ